MVSYNSHQIPLQQAANACNGQLAYADAIAKGVNTAKIAAREGIEGTRELVSQGIYYSYRPAELVVDTGKAIASMPKPYKTAWCQYWCRGRR